MLLGILSDTHNHIANLQKALDVFRKDGIETVIHCGDLTTPATALALTLAGFRVIHALGNGDVAYEEIHDILMDANPQNFSGELFTGPIDGKQIAVIHGHNYRQLTALETSGRYDYVFSGHFHQRKNIPIHNTRLINPGALGGAYREERSFCTLDLSTGDVSFHKI